MDPEGWMVSSSFKVLSADSKSAAEVRKDIFINSAATHFIATVSEQTLYLSALFLAISILVYAKKFRLVLEKCLAFRSPLL